MSQTARPRKNAAALLKEAAAFGKEWKISKRQARPMMLAVAINSSNKASETLPDTL